MKEHPPTICGSCGQIIDYERDDRIEAIVSTHRRMRILGVMIGVAIFLDLVFR